jgi:hypothetical protein
VASPQAVHFSTVIHPLLPHPPPRYDDDVIIPTVVSRPLRGHPG